jgi:hypothetical protein
MHDFTPAEAYRYEQDIRWETTRSSVEAFRVAHGRWPQASTNDSDERYLGQWLGQSRRDARAGRLSPQRQHALDEMGARIGVDWHTGQPINAAAPRAKTSTETGAGPEAGPGAGPGAGTGVGAALVASLLDGTGWEGASFSARLGVAERFFTYHGHWPDPADEMPANMLADTVGVDPPRCRAVDGRHPRTGPLGGGPATRLHPSQQRRPHAPRGRALARAAASSRSDAGAGGRRLDTADLGTDVGARARQGGGVLPATRRLALSHRRHAGRTSTWSLAGQATTR